MDAARRAMELLAGISSGASVHAPVALAHRRQHSGKLVVCMVPSTSERYISTDLFAECE